MNNKWVIVALTLVIGFVGGMVTTKHMSGNLGTDEHKGEHDGHGHAMMYEVPVGAIAPTLDVVVHKDPKSGYNLELVTTNFVFAPQDASTEAVMGEGHAHVYVDGTKINRVYGHWYHLPTVGGVGEHEVRVELSANNHSAYAKDGVIIDVTKAIVVEPDASFDAGKAQEHTVAVTERSLSPKVVTVTQGDSVRLVVTTDEAGEFHVAGYEIEKDMDIEGEITIEFVADKAGRYNLELHPAMAMEKMEGEGEMHMESDHDSMGEDIEIGALVVNPK